MTSGGDSKSQVLLIGGMHRSGTSLTAQWLAKCGLFVGDELIPADWTNKKGHFEDKDVSQFQREILATSGVDHYCPPGPEIVPGKEHFERAREVIAARDGHPLWGFKDPRTTLLLDFWRELLPDAKFLFVFRRPTLVVDSLLRRDRKGFSDLRRWRRYLRVWMRYNEDLLDFIARHPERCLTFHVFDLLGNSGKVLDYLRADWGLPLERIEIETVADPALLTSKATPWIDRLNPVFAAGVNARFEALMAAHQESIARVGADSV